MVLNVINFFPTFLSKVREVFKYIFFGFSKLNFFYHKHHMNYLKICNGIICLWARLYLFIFWNVKTIFYCFLLQNSCYLKEYYRCERVRYLIRHFAKDNFYCFIKDVSYLIFKEKSGVLLWIDNIIVYFYSECWK